MKNKGSKRRTVLFLFIFIGLIVYMSYTTFSYWKQIFINISSKKDMEKNYIKLTNEQKTLEDDLVKLQDPEYAAKYAREKYLYTADGELIIKIIEENDEK